MRYLDKSFSVPVGSSKVSQLRWDYATMPRDEFVAKYGEAVYNELSENASD